MSSMFALTTMNILSSQYQYCEFVFLGTITANIPSYIIDNISIILFAMFGIKMIVEGYRMNNNDPDIKEMGKNIEMEKIAGKNVSKLSLYLIVFLKIFSLIFLAEWGDRSQLSTILLSAKQNRWAVGFGSFCGNFLTNATAVLCSRIVSEIISVQSGMI
ncbi:hypothetical protein BLA29_006520 [Euroglyphus maynei]|uniref:GDT1 family protein n=1 Tax=Euroglyphus maynei TaxID=6958 RepID=A0A1Y3AN50_EURMA|nr:hypothetical protein BLA29_006520 [Euroglyphus maynei]